MSRALILLSLATLTVPFPGGEGSPETRVAAAASGTSRLRPAYTIRMTSDWPQLSVEGLDCVNGGEEVITGKLVRLQGGQYVGELERAGTIRFCGIHGAAREACSLTLTTQGGLKASGEAQLPADGTAPVLLLEWRSAPTGTSVAVGGNCPREFGDAVRQMYLGAARSVELPLPGAGESARSERLEDFGWKVEVRSSIR